MQKQLTETLTDMLEQKWRAQPGQTDAILQELSKLINTLVVFGETLRYLLEQKWIAQRDNIDAAQIDLLVLINRLVQQIDRLKHKLESKRKYMLIARNILHEKGIALSRSTVELARMLQMKI